MSLLAVAGSAYYVSSNVIRDPIMWDPRVGTAGTAFTFGATPFNGSFSSNGVDRWGKPFVALSGDEHATFVMGLGFYFSAPASDGEWDVAGVSTDGGSTFVATLALYRSGGAYGLRVKRGATVIADTGTGLLSVSPLRYFVEWKITLGTASNGSTEVWINEVSRASASSVTTAPSGSTWNAFAWHSNSAVSTAVDDFYANNGAGSAPLNAQLGDVVVAIVGPSGDSSVAWTTHTNALHWKSLQRSSSPAADLADATAGHRDVFDTAAPAPEPGTLGGATPPGESYTAGKQVFAVVSAMTAKAGALPRKLKYGIRENSTDALQEMQLTTGFTTYYQIHTTAPDGSGWTTTKLDALQLVLETGANT